MQEHVFCDINSDGPYFIHFCCCYNYTKILHISPTAIVQVKLLQLFDLKKNKDLVMIEIHKDAYIGIATDYLHTIVASIPKCIEGSYTSSTQCIIHNVPIPIGHCCVFLHAENK